MILQGKPEVENSRSCRCECPALVRLLRALDNSWYITEHRESPNQSMSLTMGEKVHWPSYKHIDVYTNDLIRQLRENNVNLGKVYSIIGSFFGSVEKVPFNKKDSGIYVAKLVVNKLMMMCARRWKCLLTSALVTLGSPMWHWQTRPTK